MAERREDPRFALESGQALGVVRQIVRQHLDRYGTVEPRVAAQVDHPHPSPAELALDRIGADAGRAAAHLGGPEPREPRGARPEGGLNRSRGTGISTYQGFASREIIGVIAADARTREAIAESATVLRINPNDEDQTGGAV